MHSISLYAKYDKICAHRLDWSWLNTSPKTLQMKQLTSLNCKPLEKKSAAIVLTTAPQVSWLNRETADEFQAIFFHSSLPRKKTEVKWKRCRWSQIWKLKSLCWMNLESSFQQNTYSLCDSIEGVLHHCYQVAWYTSFRWYNIQASMYMIRSVCVVRSIAFKKHGLIKVFGCKIKKNNDK